MSENKLTDFDKLIKDSVESFEAPADASAWEAIESKLNTPNNKVGKSTLKWVLGITSAAAIVAISIFLLQSNNEVQETKPIKLVEKVKSASQPKIDQESTIEIVKPEPQIEEATKKEVKPKITQPKLNTPKQVEEKVNSTIEVSQKTETKVDERKEVKPSINSIEIISIMEVCANEVFTLKPSDSMAVKSIYWDFGDGKSAKRFSAKHKFENAGNYFITLTMVDANNKISKAEKQIVVNPKPIADFDYETTDFHCHNSSICFNANEPNLKFRWNFGDSKISTEENPKHTYFRKGHYNVKLMAENEFGCTDSTQKQVYVMRAYNLLAPNAFSPNGDGQNDTWMPIALLNSDKVFDLKIVDANGLVVFNTNNPSNSWDGSIANGARAKSGDIFFWIAVVKDETGNMNEYGGSIVISN